MTQLAIDIEPTAPLRAIVRILPGDWLGLVPPTVSWDDAAAIFERKHGKPMRELHPSGPIALAGPIEEQP